MLTVHLSLKQEVQAYMDTSMNLALMQDITAPKVKVTGEKGAVTEIKLTTCVYTLLHVVSATQAFDHSLTTG